MDIFSATIESILATLPEASAVRANKAFGLLASLHERLTSNKKQNVSEIMKDYIEYYELRYNLLTDSLKPLYKALEVSRSNYYAFAELINNYLKERLDSFNFFNF